MQALLQRLEHSWVVCLDPVVVAPLAGIVRALVDEQPHDVGDRHLSDLLAVVLAERHGGDGGRLGACVCYGVGRPFREVFALCRKSACFVNIGF